MHKPPLFIGIAGGSGAGKSYIAHQLQMALRPFTCTILQQDWYYHDSSGIPFIERQLINFDHPEALDWALLYSHITRLLGGKDIEQLYYDFARHCRIQTEQWISPGNIVILEGILILHSAQLRSLMDLRLFVETDNELRFQRRLDRDTRERGRSVDSVRVQYENTVAPMHGQFVEPSRRYADIVIRGGEVSGREIRSLVKIVKRCMQ